MRGKPFVLCNISKTYKVYGINLSLRKLKGRMTKVIRFLCANQSVSSGLSACKGPTGEVQGMSERSDEIPPQKSVDQILDQIFLISTLIC